MPNDGRKDRRAQMYRHNEERKKRCLILITITKNLKIRSFDDYIIGATSKNPVFTMVSLLRPEFFLDFY